MVGTITVILIFYYSHMAEVDAFVPDCWQDRMPNVNSPMSHSMICTECYSTTERKISLIYGRVTIVTIVSGGRSSSPSLYIVYRVHTFIHLYMQTVHAVHAVHAVLGLLSMLSR